MNGKFLGNLGLSVVIVALLSFAVMKVSASSTGIEGVLLPEITVSDSTAELLHSVKLARSAVNVQGLNHQVEAIFGIENTGEHDIKNVSILCTLYDKNNKEQGRDKWVVYNTVKSHNRDFFTFADKRFISASVVRSDCQIVDLDIVTPLAITVHRGAAGHGGTHGDAAASAHETGHGTAH